MRDFVNLVFFMKYLGILEFLKKCFWNSRIPSLRGVSETKQSHLLRLGWDCFGILNGIASVALLPRNDGILEFFMMRSSGQAGG